VVGFYPRAMTQVWSTALYPNADLLSQFIQPDSVERLYRRARHQLRAYFMLQKLSMVIRVCQVLILKQLTKSGTTKMWYLNHW
jgi:hypothetical protein